MVLLKRTAQMATDFDEVKLSKRVYMWKSFFIHPEEIFQSF